MVEILFEINLNRWGCNFILNQFYRKYVLYGCWLFSRGSYQLTPPRSINKYRNRQFTLSPMSPIPFLFTVHNALNSVYNIFTSVFILGWSQNLVLGLIEGDIRWPTRLLSEDSQLTLTIRGDGRVFRRPKVELLRNKHIIHKEDFFLSKDLPARIEFHFGCDLFKAKGLYEVIS